MSSTPEVIKIGQGQFHYIEQDAALISVHDIMSEMEKLCVDDLRKLEKSKTYFTSKASIPLRTYEMQKEELEKCRKLIRTFGRKYMKNMGV